MGDSLTWVSPLGVEFPLTGTPGLYRGAGTVGRFMPTFEVTEREAPHGATLVQTRTRPRNLDIPFFVLNEADTVTVRTLMRNIASSMNPARGTGVGKLRYGSPTGVVRELSCLYTGGLDAAADRDGYLHRFVLGFRALDPFWYNIVAETASFIGGGTITPFFPFFPLVISASQIFGEVVSFNSGDVEAWPVWSITGPASGIILRNTTTGGIIDLGTLAIVAGEGLSIDTRPGYKTIVKYDGTNLYPNLSVASHLWSVLPGNNAIRVEMAGTTGDSQVSMEYFARFLAP